MMLRLSGEEGNCSLQISLRFYRKLYSVASWIIILFLLDM